MLRLLRREGLIEAYEDRPIHGMIRKGLRNELNIARAMLRPLPRTRFVIFAQGRTGSTLLTSTLDTHPQIACMDEILSVPRAFPIRFVGNAARSSASECFGFHVKIYQLTSWQRVVDVHGWLGAMHRRGWKIIFLRRENLLRHVVSNTFAEAAGAYHHRQGEKTKRPDQIVLPIDHMRKMIAERRRLGSEERAALSGIPHLELVYERDLENADRQTGTFARIQAFLGVEHSVLETSLTKAVAKPLGEVIANFGEVRDALKGTAEEVFLDE
jgi:LPS sulfotransferase NodH